MFTVHGRSKTGEISPRTYQVEGPNYRGYMLRVRLEKGKYLGQAAVPQTIRGPYYPTFIDARNTKAKQGHHFVSFSFGSRLDPKIKKAIHEMITRLGPSSFATRGGVPAPNKSNK